MARAIVVFGAAVGSDGQASPTLRRRAHFALIAAQRSPGDWIFCSGGVGRFGPSEAVVMADILVGQGINPDRIIRDEASLDTLQNVVAAASFIHERQLDGAVACTDGYHLPRVTMLFSVLGVACSAGPIEKRRMGTNWSYWLGMRARECAAYPYDLAVVMARRKALIKSIRA